MITVAFYSIKGGVGKSAAAVNISFLAAKEEKKTLLLDLDPQGSASFYFRVRSAKKYNKKTLVRGGKNINKNIKGTDYENLDSLPSDFSYRNLDLQLGLYKKSKIRLATLLKQFTNEYDCIFLDCPPSISLVSENVFRAAQIILVPVIPTTLSILTLEKLLDFFKKKKLDSQKILYFFSMVEARKKMHRQIMLEVKNQPIQQLKTVIPYSADVEKMGLYRQPLTAKHPQSAASLAYIRLWKEIKNTIYPGK